MPQPIQKQFIVHGRVQNVGYRDFVLGRARSLGLTGTVRNLDDGTVEVVAEGEADELAALKRDLAQGPPAARVDSINESTRPPTGKFTGFRVEF